VKTNGQRAAHDVHKQHAAKLQLPWLRPFPSTVEDRASFDGGGERPKPWLEKKGRKMFFAKIFQFFVLIFSKSLTKRTVLEVK
jgi:hypothetical protein